MKIIYILCCKWTQQQRLQAAHVTTVPAAAAAAATTTTTTTTTYLLTYLLTYSLTPWCRTLFEKLNVTQLVKKNPAFLWKPKVHYRVHKSPPLDPILGQPNPLRPIDPNLPKVHLNVTLPHTPRSSQWSLPFAPTTTTTTTTTTFLKKHLQSFADLWPTLMGFSIYI
jgi:hypothetical protein